MQVAQILQVLAMSRWETPDSRLSDLYSNFDKEVSVLYLSGLHHIFKAEREENR